MNYFILLSFFLVLSILYNTSNADISGMVFRDYNYNGELDANEPGIPWVTVSVQFSDGTTDNTVTTMEDGTFQVFSTSDGDMVRLFAMVDDFYFQGAQSMSTTTNPAFVTAPQTNVYIGFAANTDFCGTTNPDVVIPCYVQGSQTSTENANLAAIVKFPFNAGTDDVNVNVGNAFNPDPPDDEPDKTVLATASEVGTTWSMEWARTSEYLFATTFMKRHSGFTGGDDNTGTVYRMMSDGSGVGAFFDFDSFGFATRGVSSVHGPDLIFDDEVAWDNVGKVSLGGMTISPNEEYLYIMNLYDRHVYRVFIGANSAAPTSALDFTSVEVPLDLPGCPSQDDVRPFALKYHNGVIFVGLVCSAESTADTEDLQAYVYLLDPSSMTFQPDPVLHEQLDFRRGRIAVGDPVSTRCTTGQAQVPVPGPVSQADWRPWVPVVSENPLGAGKQCGYPQPLLSDLDFGYDGFSMYLGFIDRYGHQSLNAETIPSDVLGEGVAAGDLLCAYWNNTANMWQFENNGVCGDHVSVTREGNSGVGNTDGPGGGEFFADDRYDGPNHQENTLGGIVALFDPAYVLSNGFDVSPKGGIRAGGVGTFTQEAGTQVRAYQIFAADEDNSFGKAAGLGEPVALCGVAPLVVGSRFWNDVNRNGVQDAGEPGFEGCSVELYSAGMVVATEMTNSNGEVFFTEDMGLEVRTSYMIRALLSDSCLGGYEVTLQDQGDNDELDSDGDNGGSFGGYTSSSLTTGVGGQNDYSHDFGFVQPAPPTTTPPVTTPPTTTPPVTTPPVTTPPTTTPPVTTPPVTTPPVTTPPTTFAPTPEPGPDPKVVCAEGKASSCDPDDAAVLATIDAVDHCAYKCLEMTECPIGFDPHALVMNYECKSKYYTMCTSLCNAGEVTKVETECVCSCSACECEIELD